jgi:hypothetical protein
MQQKPNWHNADNIFYKMEFNIIHLPHRIDRLETLYNELETQNIKDYKMWDGIIDEELVCRGISQAHKQIVRHFKKMDIPMVLIAEDDVHFTAPGAFPYFLNNIPHDFDIYLAGIMYGTITADGITENFSGTTLYIIHERFYDTFLSLPEEYHIDRALMSKGKFIVCDPFAAIQHDGFSDNKKRFCEYEPYIKNRKLFRVS